MIILCSVRLLFQRFQMMMVMIMDISKLVLVIQFSLSFTCLLVQIYALCSARWGIFGSRTQDLGLMEEQGHYGLWSTCTYRKLMPPEVDNHGQDDGTIVLDTDCDPMNTFFSPGHPRAFIAFFVICHTILLMIYSLFVLYRLLEMFYHDGGDNVKNDNGGDGDLEYDPINNAKRWLLILFNRLFVNCTRSSSPASERYIRNHIRNKLYAISGAVLSTMLALAGALAPSRNPLRETNILIQAHVAETNYHVYRGPGFWAQLTTMILDMLITTLIVIEVRILFVKFHPESVPDVPTNDIENNVRSSRTNELDDIIVNPFFRNDSVRSDRTPFSYRWQPARPPSSSPGALELRGTTATTTTTTTTPKVLDSSTDVKPPPPSSTEDLYARVTPKKMPIQPQETSYCNPMYHDD